MSDTAPASADVLAAFRKVLGLCRVHEGETVLVFTDPRFPHPHYPPAAFAAARSLGATAYLMVSQGDQALEDRLVTPARNRGLAGANHSELHFDICCRNVDLYLDGEPIIRNERFLLDELG